MAKEVKNNKAVVLTDENIVDQLDKKNRADTAMTNEIIAEINKEKDDRKKAEIKQRYLKATYQRDLALLQRRYGKRRSEIDLYKIRQSGRLLRLMTGFKVTEEVLEYAKTPDDVFNCETLDEKAKTISLVVDEKAGKKETFKLGDDVPGVIDIVDYDEYLKKLNKKVTSMFEAAEEEHNKNVNKLEAAYGNYYNYSWRW